MAEEILSPDKITREKLKSIYDSAFMTYSLDSDGDLLVQEGYRILTMASPEKETVVFSARFKFRDSSNVGERYFYVNDVNNNVVGLRASVVNNDRAWFDFTLVTDGGLTARQIVMTTKRFSKMIEVALKRDTSDIIE